MDYVTWQDENGPHIHFYDENITYDEWIEMLLELGLIIETPELS